MLDLLHLLLHLRRVLAIRHKELRFMVVEQLLDLCVQSFDVLHQHLMRFLYEILVCLCACFLQFCSAPPTCQTWRMVALSAWRGIYLRWLDDTDGCRSLTLKHRNKNAIKTINCKRISWKWSEQQTLGKIRAGMAPMGFRGSAAPTCSHRLDNLQPRRVIDYPCKACDRRCGRESIWRRRRACGGW